MKIISAMNPTRVRDSFTEVWLMVWFEELSGPVPCLATPFDSERHGKELWIRAMGGEYGPIEILDDSSLIARRINHLKKRDAEKRSIMELEAPRQLLLGFSGSGDAT